MPGPFTTCRSGAGRRAAGGFHLRPLAKIVPAESRWGTFGPSLALQAAGHLCHRILPRVLRRAFANAEQLRDGGGDDVADFRAHITKKTKQRVEFHSSQDTLHTLLVALLATEPLDKLSARLQHMDHRIGSVLGTVGLAGAGGGGGQGGGGLRRVLRARGICGAW